jgi:hypothetical protein
MLRYQRESLLRAVTGHDDDAARREFVGSGTTPLRLTRHVTRAELPCGRVWKWAVSEVRK